MSEPRAKATAPPHCKICGHAHRLRDPHVFGKSVGSSSGRTADFDSAKVGSNPAPATKPAKLRAAKKALELAESKPPKPPKKRKPRMAKAGRKPVKTDARSIKARERMAAKRAAKKPAAPADAKGTPDGNG